MRSAITATLVLTALLVSSVAFAAEPPVEPTPPADPPAATFTVRSERPIASIGERLSTVAKSHGYGVVATHDMRAMMEKKGVALGREVMVFEVCNPGHAKAVLSVDVTMATVLPCRVAAWVQDGKTVLAMVNPSQILGMFPGSQAVEPIAQQVQRDLQTIMRETAAPDAP